MGWCSLKDITLLRSLYVVQKLCQSFQLFDRCGPKDYMSDLCDYQNKTFTWDKVDNYHTGEFGKGVHVGVLCRSNYVLFGFTRNFKF